MKRLTLNLTFKQAAALYLILSGAILRCKGKARVSGQQIIAKLYWALDLDEADAESAKKARKP